MSAAVASQSSSSRSAAMVEKEKEEGETDDVEFMFHSWIFLLVFLFAFLPFVQEPVVLQRQDSMFFLLKTVEVPQCSFQSWKCSGTIFSSMCARLCLRSCLRMPCTGEPHHRGNDTQAAIGLFLWAAAGRPAAHFVFACQFLRIFRLGFALPICFFLKIHSVR